MFKRFRRLRLNSAFRDMLRQTLLGVDDFIYPLFVVEGSGIRKEIPAMPGVYHFSIDELLKECDELVDLGIKR